MADDEHGLQLHHDVTAPIPGEFPHERTDRVIRHVLNEHPGMEMLDPDWLHHPIVAHEALHRAVPQDLPQEGVEVDPRLTDVADDLQNRLRTRLSEMLGATLQPVVIDAVALQVALTTRIWLRDHAHGLVPDSREQIEMLRVAELAVREP